MSGKRYSRLAPFSIEQRIALAGQALNFFSPVNYAELCELLGKPKPPTIQPFSVFEFLQFLSKTGDLPEANRYQQRIRELLNILERRSLLSAAGTRGNPITGQCYYLIRELTNREKKGILW